MVKTSRLLFVGYISIFYLRKWICCGIILTYNQNSLDFSTTMCIHMYVIKKNPCVHLGVQGCIKTIYSFMKIFKYFLFTSSLTYTHVFRLNTRFSSNHSFHCLSGSSQAITLSQLFISFKLFTFRLIIQFTVLPCNCH